MACGAMGGSVAGMSFAEMTRSCSGSDTFRVRAGTSPPRTVINGQPHPAMAAEGGRDDRTTLGQYPGFDLPISELCHALKTKLAQAWDSRYAYITATRTCFSIINSAYPSRHSFPLPLVRTLQQARQII